MIYFLRSTFFTLTVSTDKKSLLEVTKFRSRSKLEAEIKVTGIKIVNSYVAVLSSTAVAVKENQNVTKQSQSRAAFIMYIQLKEFKNFQRTESGAK